MPINVQLRNESVKPNKDKALQKPIDGGPDLALCQGRSPWANDI